MGRTKLKTHHRTNKMQSRNTSLVLLFCLGLALTFKEAQQIPVNNYEFNWSHSKKIDIDSFFADSKKWYDATKEARNEDSEGEESLFDMDFPMEPLVSNFSDSHFSLYINGKEYQPEEMIQFAKKIFEHGFDRTSLSKFPDETQALDPNEIADIVGPLSSFLLFVPLLSMLPLLLVLPIILLSVFIPFVPLLMFLPFLADFASVANVATVADTIAKVATVANTVANVTNVANITTIAPTVVSTVATTIANEIVNLPKSI